MPGKHNFRKMMGYKDGGGLREPTNKGLASLPTEVRNKMGFMKKGGKPKGYMYGGKVKKMKDGGPGSEEYKRTMNLIESGSVKKGMKKADRTGEAKISGDLVKASSAAPDSPYFKSTRKADEMINTKRDLGGGARMTLSDKKTAKPMSGADKERGVSTTPKKKKTDPQTTAKNKAKMNPPTFKASQEKIKDKDVKLTRRLNVKSPTSVAKITGGVDSNPRKKFSGFDSESKERKVRGMKSGGKPKAYGMKHGGQACRGGGKATRGTKFSIR